MMMITFCKTSVHSFFNSFTSTSQQDSITTDRHRNTGCAGLSILAKYDDNPKPNNVIESSSLINASRKIKEAPIASEENNEPDHAEIRIKVLGGGDADGGLASCTESLGFESYTEGSMSINECGIDFYEKARVYKNKSKFFDKRKERNFPPPLKSLNVNGKPMFVLKPIRKDGRLELTEVQIHRKESIHACRQDGRLRMYLVELHHRNDGNNIVVDTHEDNKLSDTKEEKQVFEEERKFPENCGGGEDCSRWLNEMVVTHGHHHNMHGWGQQRVTIR